MVGNDLDLANDIILGTNVGVAGRGLLEAGASLGTSTISGDVTIRDVLAGHPAECAQAGGSRYST